MTIIVTALSSLSRRIWPYALVAAISVWCLYGWHAELTALFSVYGIAEFALYEKPVAEKQVASPQSEARPGEHL